MRCDVIRAAALCIALGAAALSAGCGGGGGGGTGGGAGQVVLKVAWPRIGKLVPYTADRVRVEVFDNNETEDTSDDVCLYGQADSCRAKSFFVDRRSASESFDTLILRPLPVRRALLLRIVALTINNINPDTKEPSFDANPVGRFDEDFGSVVSGGSMPIRLEPGPQAAQNIDIDLEAPIERLKIFSNATLIHDSIQDPTPDAAGQIRLEPTQNVADVVNLTVTAHSADGSLVLLQRFGDNTFQNSDVTWKVDDNLAVDDKRADEVRVARTGDSNFGRTVTGTSVNVARNTQVAREHTLTVSVKKAGPSDAPTDSFSTKIRVVVGQPTKGLLEQAAILVVGSLTDLTSEGAEPFLLTDKLNITGLLPETRYAVPAATVDANTPTKLALLTRSSVVTPRFIGYDQGGLRTDPDEIHTTLMPSAVYTFAINSLRPNFLDGRSRRKIKENGQEIPARDLADGRAESQALYVLTSADTVQKFLVDPASGQFVGGGEDSPPALSFATGLSGAARIAVGRENGQDRIYVAAGATVKKFQPNGSPADGFQTPTIGSGSFNPSGESFDTILDIATENGYLYVLGRQGSLPARVHVFNTQGEWLYSLTGFDDERMRTAKFISASSAGSNGGEGRVFVAYTEGEGSSNARALVLQYVRR